MYTPNTNNNRNPKTKRNSNSLTKARTTPAVFMQQTTGFVQRTVEIVAQKLVLLLPPKDWFALLRRHTFVIEQKYAKVNLGANFGIAFLTLTKLSCFACSQRSASLRLGLVSAADGRFPRPRFGPSSLLTTAQHFPLRTPTLRESRTMVL